jgi:hypothetical protein
VFSDTGLQSTLTDEMLLYLNYRLDALVKHEVAFRMMWGTMHVALKNMVRLWEDIEVDLSCARCEKLLVDAMIISPCGMTVCRSCLREDDEHSFDAREREGCACQDHDGSIPNQLLRRFSKAFSVREVSGAITPVPSEALLQELDYELRTIAESSGLLRSQQKNAASAQAPSNQAMGRAGARGARGLRSPEGAAGIGTPNSTSILVAGSKITQSQATSRRQSKAPRRKSVVFAGGEEGGDEAKSIDNAAPPSPTKSATDEPDPNVQGFPLAIRDAGLTFLTAAFEASSIQFSCKKIANAYTTQFRR